MSTWLCSSVRYIYIRQQPKQSCSGTIITCCTGVLNDEGFLLVIWMTHRLIHADWKFLSIDSICRMKQIKISNYHNVKLCNISPLMLIGLFNFQDYRQVKSPNWFLELWRNDRHSSRTHYSKYIPRKWKKYRSW